MQKDSNKSNDNPKIKGIDVLKHALESYIPTKSGIYRMIGEGGRILYIGKAKNLKNRVSNYTNLKGLSNRIARMVVQIEKIEITITKTESEALLLESHLIKENKPPYNILLKDDKSFPYIALDLKHEFPRIYKHRGKKRKGVEYFGPYSSAWAVDQAISAIQKIFLLRPCTDSYFSNRRRPCLEYEIKRCSAPCVGNIKEKEYKSLTKSAKDFLDGKSEEIRKILQDRMQEASSKLEFEVAAEYRNRIQALSSIKSTSADFAKSVMEADIIGIYRKSGKVCIQIFFLRGGRMLGNTAFYPKGAEESEFSEILEYFILTFYESKPIPKNIIISDDTYSRSFIESHLSEQKGEKTNIFYPLKGEKKKLVDLAVSNAVQSLEIKIAEEETSTNTLKIISEIFNIEGKINRVEVFDNSHIFGSDAIGAMIVAGNDEEGKWGFQKKLYRRFNVDSGRKVTGGDDFDMMRQVMKRRYSKLYDEYKKNNNSNYKSDDEGANAYNQIFPDLILIDGGLGQLSVVEEVFEEIGVKNLLKYVAIAKGVDRNAGREDFYLPQQDPFKLEKTDPSLYFLQNLRDEAHRFAIEGHRAKRSKNLIKSKLDEIPDIGAVRKKALLSHFGSAKAVEEAKLQELVKVDGISKKTAEKIYYWFREA